MPLPIRPVAVLKQSSHLSGVNALSIAEPAKGTLVVVSGGDDQALHATLMQEAETSGHKESSDLIVRASIK
eukprot:scaffold651164_cov46-Prasinocladus_malaysianus.AAC.1